MTAPISCIAIDPGPERSALVLLRDDVIVWHGINDNEDIIASMLSDAFDEVPLVLEMIASYGMPVGAETFETCVWIGRFMQAWKGECSRLFRRDVKLHVCASPRANDATIRRAMLDRFGGPGTKRNPGMTYGLRADEWQALALAATWCDLVRNRG